jgi:hypothetical protein
MIVLADWGTQAAGTVIARTYGGPTDVSPLGTPWSLSLRRGETVGMILSNPTDDNKMYYGIHNLALFQMAPDGSVTNGQLFTKRSVALIPVTRAAVSGAVTGTHASPPAATPRAGSR